MFCYLEGRGLILVLTQGGNQLAVFGLGADGDAQAFFCVHKRTIDDL